MIICDADQCVSCGLCRQICPTSAITLSDETGFYRPIVDESKCVRCGKCQKNCVVVEPPELQEGLQEVYAVWHKDEPTRRESSSGGAFSALASTVLREGGVVFGCAYDEKMIPRIVKITDEKELFRLRGSKYVQADVGNAYKEAKESLLKGLTVLYSGTPCQIAGLKRFLGSTDASRLFTCDLLCHGPSSSLLFKKYICFLEKTYRKAIVFVNFRDKRIRWGNGLNTTSISFYGKEHKRYVPNFSLENSYWYGFANSFSINTGCFHCGFRKIERVGDITLADFWRLGEKRPFQRSTRNGISLTLVNTEQGKRLFDKASSLFNYERRDVEEVRSNFNNAFSKPKAYDKFNEEALKLDYQTLARKYLRYKGLKLFLKTITPRLWEYNVRRFLRKIRK